MRAGRMRSTNVKTTAYALLLLMVGLAAGGRAQANDRANARLAARALVEKMTADRSDAVDEIYSPGFVVHGSTGDFSLKEDDESATAWRAALPDLSVKVERTVSNGDLVAVHWTMSGTNSGTDSGMPGKGVKVSLQGMSMFRFSKGHIVEEWTLVDIAALMTQLGSVRPLCTAGTIAAAPPGS